MGIGASNEFNADISKKGDLNIYICGNINYKTGLQEDAINYNIIKKIFNNLEGSGKIVSEKFMNKIYPYEYRKLDREEGNSEKKKKNITILFYFLTKLTKCFQKFY